MNKKSVGAIVAAVRFIILVTTVVDIVLHVVQVYPPMSQPLDGRLSALATSYRIVIGVVGIVLGLVGVIATWNAGLGPRWYPILLVVLALPQSRAGGKWFEMQQARRAWHCHGGPLPAQFPRPSNSRFSASVKPNSVISSPAPSA